MFGSISVVHTYTVTRPASLLEQDLFGKIQFAQTYHVTPVEEAAEEAVIPVGFSARRRGTTIIRRRPETSLEELKRQRMLQEDEELLDIIQTLVTSGLFEDL